MLKYVTIRALIVGALTAIAIAFGSPTFANGYQGYVNSLDPVMRKHIQIALRDKGYNPGPIDGNFGRRSMAALMAFRRDRNIFRNDDIDGVLTPGLARELLGIQIATGDDGEDLSLEEELKILEMLGLIKSADYWKDYQFPD